MVRVITKKYFGPDINVVERRLNIIAGLNIIIMAIIMRAIRNLCVRIGGMHKGKG